VPLPRHLSLNKANDEDTQEILFKPQQCFLFMFMYQLLDAFVTDDIFTCYLPPLLPWHRVTHV